jgi:type IV pilus assembly protein PilW
MHLTTRHSRLRQAAGFSLVELMVGLAIGLLATIVIIQVMSVFEAQRRTTTGSADAQTNGGIALYSIARELQQAGYPLLPVADSSMECADLVIEGVVPAVPPTRLTPITIANGPVAAGINPSDSITIRYGTSQMGGALTQIGTTVASTPPTDGILATVLSSYACKKDDVTLVSAGNKCYMSSVFTDPTTHTVAPIAPNTVPTYKVKVANKAGVASGANLACLGNWLEVTFAVNPLTGNLDRQATVNGAVGAAVASVVGIVNLQAQYGISDVASSNKVTAWVNATGTWATPTVADRNRIKAIRIAVVARNAKMEPSVVTAACSSTTAASPAGLCAWEGSAASPAPAVDLSAADANWAKYRYRVYETVLPLRNVIWSKDVL